MKALFAKLGLTADQLAAATKELDAVPEPQSPQLPPFGDATTAAVIAAEVKKALEPVVAKNEQLEKLLGEEAAARKAAADALKQDADKRRAAEIQTVLDDAIKAGKIPADNKAKRDEWQKKFEESFETAKFGLEQIPAAPTSNKTADKTADKTSKSGEARTGMASHIRSDKIAEYVNSVPIAQAAKN